MRYVAIAIALWMTFFAVNAQGRMTEGSVGMMADLLQDDLSTYLEGGQAVFSADWERMATPWTTDQEIGIRYSRGTVAADNFYGSKTIFLQGHYLSAENWIGDSYRVQMALVVAVVDRSDSAFLQDATNGSIVRMACRSTGKEFEFVYLDHCQSQQFAMAELVQKEMAIAVKRRSPADMKLIDAAAAFDRKIPANDPCRNTMGGCIEMMHGALR